MIFRVTMKDPDTLDEAIREAIEKDLEKLGLAEDERDALTEVRAEKISDICQKWFEYGEYLCVEIDTDAKTCQVIVN